VPCVAYTVASMLDAASQRRSMVVLVAIVLFAFNLRPGLVTIGPLLNDIERTLGLSGIALGALTSLPILALGVASGSADRLGRSLGWGRGIILASLLIAAGIALRSAANGFALYVGAVLLGAGAGLGSVYIPALLKARNSTRIGLLMGMYSATLTLGATVSVGVTPAINRLTHGDWRATLGFWMYPALVSALVWIPLRRAGSRQPPRKNGTSLWQNGFAWAITANMGVQSMIFYSLASWLGTLLAARGLSLASIAYALSAFYFPQIFISLGAPVLVARSRHQGWLAAAFMAESGFGIIAVLYGPTNLVIASCLILGIGMGAVFGAALTFLVLRASHAQAAAQLSGMAQSVGYMIAAIGPLALGVLRSTPDPKFASAVWLSFLVVLGIFFGFLSGQPRFVDGVAAESS